MLDRRKLRSIALFFVSMVLMTLAAFLMLLVSLPTFFGARRFCAEVIGKALGHAVLRIAGIRLIVHRDGPFPEKQAIYVANHSSSLDFFILIALALPNTRFFMKRKYLYFGPLGFLAWLTGTFFTPPQTRPEERIRCFQAAERALRRSGESAFLSPEGTRVTSGKLGPFNRGTFHLATNLGAPIVPLVITIPPEIDPGKGFGALPGTVHVHVHEPVSTVGWKLDELERNKNAVRMRFLGYLDAARARHGVGPDSARV